MSSSKYNFTKFVNTLQESILGDIGLSDTGIKKVNAGFGLILDEDTLRDCIARFSSDDDTEQTETNNDRVRSLFFDLLCYDDPNYEPADAKDAARQEKFKKRKKNETAIVNETFHKSVDYFNTMVKILSNVKAFNDVNIDMTKTDNDLAHDINEFVKTTIAGLRSFYGEKVGEFDVGTADTAGKVGYTVDTEKGFLADLSELLVQKQDKSDPKNIRDCGSIIRFVGIDDQYSGLLNWLSTYNSVWIGYACAASAKVFIDFISTTTDTKERNSKINRVSKILPDSDVSNDVQKLRFFIEEFDKIVDECKEINPSLRDSPKNLTVTEIEPEEESGIDPDETEEERAEREEAEEKVRDAEQNNAYNINDDEPTDERTAAVERIKFDELKNVHSVSDEEAKDDVVKLLKNSGYGMMIYRPKVRFVDFQRRKFGELDNGKRVRTSTIHDTARSYVSMLPSTMKIVFSEDPSARW